MFRFNPDQLGERLHALRRRYGQTLRDLGSQAAVNYVTLSKIERGKMPQVSADIVVRLAVALGVSADYLLGLQEDAQTTSSTARPREDAHETKPATKRQRTRKAASVA